MIWADIPQDQGHLGFLLVIVVLEICLKSGLLSNGLGIPVLRISREYPTVLKTTALLTSLP